jgi:hypothetical protein
VSIIASELNVIQFRSFVNFRANFKFHIFHRTFIRVFSKFIVSQLPNCAPCLAALPFLLSLPNLISANPFSAHVVVSRIFFQNIKAILGIFFYVDLKVNWVERRSFVCMWWWWWYCFANMLSMVQLVFCRHVVYSPTCVLQTCLWSNLCFADMLSMVQLVFCRHVVYSPTCVLQTCCL